MKHPDDSDFESAIPADLPSAAPLPASDQSDNSTTDAADSGGLIVQPKQLKSKVTERLHKADDGTMRKCWDVNVGSALLRVYFTPNGDRELFTMSYWIDGKRKRQVLPTLDAAITEAKKIGSQLARGDFVAADLTAAERMAAARALKLLSAVGVPLELAAAEYASAVKRLGTVSLSQAVDFYLKRHPVDMPAKMVKEVVDEMIQLKRADKLSDRYLTQLKYDLKHFADRFHGRLGDVSGANVDAWLRSFKVGPRTRNNLRRSVHLLFNFAIARKYLPKDHDEMDAVPLAKDKGGDIEIFTPAEMADAANMFSSASACRRRSTKPMRPS